MEEDQELKFVCKLCDKRYPNGMSLGGHMRSHVISNSVKSELKFYPNKNDDSNLPSLNGGSSGYGLRENPKKSWRAVDLSSHVLQDNVCKQCGKGFQSLKALCGHMACHSERERVSNDDRSWTIEDQKLVMDNFSDGKKTRSIAKRYNRPAVKCSSFCLSNNGSSSVSEIIEQEQEEVAMSLMMLSRDLGNWVGFDLAWESSDNNSVVLETKSPSMDMKIGRKEGLDSGETLVLKKLGGRKSKSSVFDGENDELQNSNSGYHRNGAKKVKSDSSVLKFLRNDDYNKCKAICGARIGASDAELSKTSKLTKNISKRSKYECSNCNKIFNSHQALGGHRPCKRVNDYADSSHIFLEYAPNGKLGELFGNKKPNVKDFSFNAKKRFRPMKSIIGHECPICLEIFKSKQALGAHKRSHSIRNFREKTNQTTFIEQEVADFPDVFDLNLPARVEDEEHGLAQFI